MNVQRMVRSRSGRGRRTARIATVAALALAGSALVAVAAPDSASAGVGCWGDYCSGRDPMTTACANDAYTVAAVDVTGARLELRWSPTCKTNWARYTQYPRGWFMGNVPLEIRAVQSTGYTQRLSYGVNGTPTGTTWSPMIYSPIKLVRAQVAYQCSGVGDCVQGVAFGQNPVSTAWK